MCEYVCVCVCVWAILRNGVCLDLQCYTVFVFLNKIDSQTDITFIWLWKTKQKPKYVFPVSWTTIQVHVRHGTLCRSVKEMLKYLTRQITYKISYFLPNSSILPNRSLIEFIWQTDKILFIQFLLETPFINARKWILSAITYEYSVYLSAGNPSSLQTCACVYFLVDDATNDVTFFI